MDEDSAELMRLASPEQTLEMLFFSLFGLVEPDSMPPLHLVPDFAKIILKLLFGIYMMVTLIVLINLLIAMMSDTYQRIQAQSDKVLVLIVEGKWDLGMEVWSSHSDQTDEQENGHAVSNQYADPIHRGLQGCLEEQE